MYYHLRHQLVSFLCHIFFIVTPSHAYVKQGKVIECIHQHVSKLHIEIAKIKQQEKPIQW